ncbi:MAG: nucleotidyl transferase AbiEii/AbiGii toxin family protein [Chloroflexota bacterium]
MTQGLAASIHDRLLNRARAHGENFNLLLDRYALERLLYRLSISEARDQYWLKGALLFHLWFDAPHRPTRDIDLLGFGPADAALLTDTIRGICAIQLEDALQYDAASVRTDEIREQARYDGLRVRLRATLGTARITVQLDVGYGDAVTPGPEEIVYPSLLPEQPSPRLRAYPRASVVAEKLEAMVSLGMMNSRLKDYFNVLALAREGRLSSIEINDAVSATFERR